MSKGNRGRRKKAGLLPTPERCLARTRFGEPCKKYPIEGAFVCGSHGGRAPQVKRKAQERIMMAQDDAAGLLISALSDEKVPFAEKRKVAEHLLNYDTRNQVQLTLARWHDNIEGVLVDVPDADIVDAEFGRGHEGPSPPATPTGRIRGCSHLWTIHPPVHASAHGNADDVHRCGGGGRGRLRLRALGRALGRRASG